MATRTLRPLVFIGALAILASACSRDGVGPSDAAVRRIDLTPQRVIVRPGDQVLFQARLIDEAGNPLEGHTYHWTNADYDVSELVGSGSAVTARIRRVGEDTIFVSAGGVRALAFVTAIDCLGDSRRENSCS